MSDDRTIPVPAELLDRLRDHASTVGDMEMDDQQLFNGAYADAREVAALLVQPVTEEPAEQDSMPDDVQDFFTYLPSMTAGYLLRRAHELADKYGELGPVPSDAWQLINDELQASRAKFPGNKHMAVALMEEVGEVARGLLEGDAANVRDEAIQVAVTAIRIFHEGDSDFAVSSGDTETAK